MMAKNNKNPLQFINRDDCSTTKTVKQLKKKNAFVFNFIGGSGSIHFLLRGLQNKKNKNRKPVFNKINVVFYLLYVI